MRSTYRLNALDQFVSPRVARHDLKWRGDGAWVEPGDLAFRKMLRFYPLKGDSAVFIWGISLAFFPLVHAGRSQFHRTWRTARLDVFDKPESYRSSFSGNLHFKRMDAGSDRFEDSLRQYFPSIEHEFCNWFDRIQSLEDIAVELEMQISSLDASYRVHAPNQAEVLEHVGGALRISQ